MNDTTEQSNTHTEAMPPLMDAHPVAPRQAPSTGPLAPLTQEVTTAAESGAAYTGAWAKPVRRRGLAPFGSLVSFVLRDYFRSAWPLTGVALLAAVHSLFFNYRSGRSHFFAIEYGLVVLLAMLTTGIMFARAARPESYAILARPVRRATYVAAILLAAWLVTMLFHLISTLIEAVRFGQWLSPGADDDPWRTLPTYVTGTVPMLVVAAAAVGLVALLSSFVSTSGVRLVVLAVLALLVMSFDSKNFPLEMARPFLQQLPPVLAPAAGALRFATEASPDPIAVASLGLLAAYALVLLALGLWFASQREMILD